MAIFGTDDRILVINIAILNDFGEKPGVILRKTNDLRRVDCQQS